MISKRGSISIFLMIILAGMIGLTFTYISVSKNVATIGYTDGLLNLSGRSVLSEYNRNLKNEYGLFAFKGSGEDINYKIDFYVGYSLEGKNNINLKSVNSDISEFSLSNVENFKKEIVDYTKYALARNIIKDLLKEEKNEEKIKPLDDKDEGRTLRNERVINALPSKSLNVNDNIISNILSNLESIDETFKNSGENYLVDLYIINNFKNMRRELSRNTFFENEVEYILKGKMNNRDNRKSLRTDIILMRNAVNLIAIYLDSTMRTQLIAAAEIITPGPAALATQILLAEAWALAESENDMRLLEHGKKIPLYKNIDTWAIDIQSIIEGKNIGGKDVDYIDTNAKTGLDYESYLQIFLFFQEDTTKLSRVMDLIQINMEGNYDGSFLIKEYNSGFYFRSKVNNREYIYEHKY